MDSRWVRRGQLDETLRASGEAAGDSEWGEHRVENVDLAVNRLYHPP